MIEVQDLWFKYPESDYVLKGISLKVPRQSYVAILGENGAGKTTLVKHFNGLLKPTRGKVLVCGLDTREHSVASLARRVGLVFQNPDHQLFANTVYEEVAFALKNFSFPEKEVKRRVEAILAELELDRYRDRSPFLLSMGERKRVALASVLCYEPDVLVLDEPTTGQDHKQKEKLAELLQRLVDKGKTVVVVTHDVEFVADHIPISIILSRGQIRGQGKTLELLSNEDLLAETFLFPPQLTAILWKLSKLGLHPAPSVEEIVEAMLQARRQGP